MLGCGGTITKLAAMGVDVTIITVAAHMPPLFTEEVHQQTIQEAKKAHQLMGVKNSVFIDLPAVCLDKDPVYVFNQKIHDAVFDVNPDILFIPFYDRHIDHRQIFDASMVISRPVGKGVEIKCVAIYETLSETHWNAPYLEPNFIPTCVVDISPHIETKLQSMSCYESQVHKFPAPRSIEALKALALFRGSQCSMAYGEGFIIQRLCM